MAIRPRQRRQSNTGLSSFDTELYDAPPPAFDMDETPFEEPIIEPDEDGALVPQKKSSIENLIEISLKIERITPPRKNKDGTFWIAGNGILVNEKGEPLRKGGNYKQYGFNATVENENLLPKYGEFWQLHGTAGAEYNGRPSINVSALTPLIVENNNFGMVRWLENTCDGIGSVISKRIVSTFGPLTAQYLSRPEELLKVDGVNETIAHNISEAWGKDKTFTEFDIFLRNFKNAKGYALFSKPQRKAFQTKYSTISEFKRVLNSNPYSLMDVKNIGFAAVDAVVIQQGRFALDHPLRIRAALEIAFRNQIESQGHTIGQASELIPAVKETLNASSRNYNKSVVIDDNLIKSELDKIKEGTPSKPNKDAAQGLVYNHRDGGFQRRDMYEAELTIALTMLKKLKEGPRMSRQEAESLTDKALSRMPAGFQLDPSQHLAVVTALQWPVCVITGGPGTGKSTVMKVFKDALKHSRLGDDEENKNGLVNIEGVSFTGKAALRLAETAQMPATTIHRLLGAQGLDDFTYNTSTPLYSDQDNVLHQIVMDEGSMTPTLIQANVFEAMPDETAFLNVGDVDQLPSVDAGQALRDMILSKLVPVVQLQRGHRQNKISGIPILAERLQLGQPLIQEDDYNPKEGEKVSRYHDTRMMGRNAPIPNLPGVVWIDPSKKAPRDGTPVNKLTTHEQAEHVFSIARDLVTELPNVSSQEVLVITPQRTSNGSNALNDILRPQRVESPNAPLDSEQQIKFKNFPKGLRLGDMVMQGQNYRSLANGQPGEVVDFATIIEDNGDKTTVPIIDFEGQRMIYTEEMALKGNLMPNNANTVHKYQGSEAPVVVIVVPDAAQRMATLENIYTAITRAKRQVYLVASDNALKNIMTMNNEVRRTGLLGGLSRVRDHLLKDIAKNKPEALNDYIEYMENNQKICATRAEKEKQRSLSQERIRASLSQNRQTSSRPPQRTRHMMQKRATPQMPAPTAQPAPTQAASPPIKRRRASSASFAPDF